MKPPRQQGERCPSCGGSAEMLARDIAVRIARRYGYTLGELQEPNRERDRVAVRKLISCVLREAGFSLPVIAHTLERDHSTILHGLRQVERAFEAGVESALPGLPFRLGGAIAR